MCALCCVGSIRSACITNTSHRYQHKSEQDRCLHEHRILQRCCFWACCVCDRSRGGWRSCRPCWAPLPAWGMPWLSPSAAHRCCRSAGTCWCTACSSCAAYWARTQSRRRVGDGGWCCVCCCVFGGASLGGSTRQLPLGWKEWLACRAK
jgi:hypothetical protein